MKFKDKLKMRFLLSFGRFYFTTILLIIVLIAAFFLFAVLESDRVTNLGKMGQVFAFLFVIAAGLVKGAFKALFFRLPKPQGVLLNKREVPELYNLINKIRKATRCPKIHHIMLNSEFNAFISERPSIGMFGWYRRYLVIGMPLLLTLTEDELKGVIAHECGHLSKAHGKSSVKIYRSRAVWEKIAKEFDKENSKGSFLVDGFIKRYLPALNSIYFSASKQHEYEADKISLAVVDKQTFSNALLKVSLYSSLIENKFWSEMEMLNRDISNPVDDVFFRLENEAAKPIPEEIINTYVDNSMTYYSLPCSTHPSYIERMGALGAGRPVISPAETNGLRKILKDKADSILRLCSKDWSTRASEGWTKYYGQTAETKNRLGELEQKRASQELNADELLERAFIIERLEGTDKALEAFKAVKEIYPDDIAAEYNIGRLLTYKGSEEGVEVLCNVMEKDYQAIPDCCYNIVNYYCYKDQKDLASEYYRYAVKFMETSEHVKGERNTLLKNDKFIPHDLSMETLQKIREHLIKYKQIKKAYVAIKHIQMSYQFPVYIIGIKYKALSKKKRKKIQNELANINFLPWDCWIVGLNGENIEIEYNMDQVMDARIV